MSWPWRQAMSRIQVCSTSRIQVCSTSLLILGPVPTVTFSSRDSGKDCKRPSQSTLTFKDSIHITSINIPLARVNVTVRSEVNGSGSIMYIREGVKNWEQYFNLLQGLGIT